MKKRKRQKYKKEFYQPWYQSTLRANCLPTMAIFIADTRRSRCRATGAKYPIILNPSFKFLCEVDILTFVNINKQKIMERKRDKKNQRYIVNITHFTGFQTNKMQCMLSANNIIVKWLIALFANLSILCP